MTVTSVPTYMHISIVTSFMDLRGRGNDILSFGEQFLRRIGALRHKDHCPVMDRHSGQCA